MVRFLRFFLFHHCIRPDHDVQQTRDSLSTARGGRTSRPSCGRGSRRRRGRRSVRDLLADERYSPAVLDFLRTTYVGRAAPPVEENWDSDEEEEERAVAAAGVMRAEEEEPGG